MLHSDYNDMAYVPQSRRNRVIVDRLAAHLTECDLRHDFGYHGDVTDVLLVRMNTSRFCFALVEFGAERDAEEAVATFKLEEYKGSLLRVCISNLDTCDTPMSADVLLWSHLLHEYPDELETAPYHVTNNWSLVKIAMVCDYSTLRFASEALLKCSESMEDAVRINPRVVTTDPPIFAHLYDNEELVKLAVTLQPQILSSVSLRMAGSREVVKAAIMNDAQVFQHASEELKLDIDLVMYAIWYDGDNLRYAPAFQGDDRVINEAVSSSGKAIKWVRDDKKTQRLALTAVENDGYAIEHLPPSFSSNMEIAMAAVRSTPFALKYLHPYLQDDIAVVTTAVYGDGRALEHASEKLKGNRGVVMVALQGKVGALRFASKCLQSDFALVMAAVRGDGRELSEADAALQDDKELVMAAVSQDGSALEFASEDMKQDKDVVMAAVRQQGGAVMHARYFSKEVALVAVRSSPDALQWLPAYLRRDEEVAHEAVMHNPCAIHFADDVMKNNPMVRIGLAHSANVDKQIELVQELKSKFCRQVEAVALFPDVDRDDELFSEVQEMKEMCMVYNRKRDRLEFDADFATEFDATAEAEMRKAQKIA